MSRVRFAVAAVITFVIPMIPKRPVGIRRPHRRRLIVLAAGLIGLLAPGAAHAQRIAGAVTDATGAVLPGVTVEARSPALIEQVRSVVTDGSGNYLIVALEPGVYSVTFSLTGFKTVLREGIQLRTGFTAEVDAQLSVGAVAETVTVSGASPIVDIHTIEQRQVIDRQIIDTIPTGKSFQSYALLVPGMGGGNSFFTSLSQDVGGMSTGQTQRLFIHGGKDQDQQLEINGLDTGDVVLPGANYSFFPDGNFEEVSVDYAGNSAEVETGGVRVNMIPREGGNRFRGHFFTTFTFPDLQADNVDQKLRDRGLTRGVSVKEVWTLNPAVGGPIVKDRLWFFAAHTTQVADILPADIFFARDPAALVYVPDLGRPASDRTTAHEQSVNLTLQATHKDKVKFYWTNSATDKPRTLAGKKLPPLFITPEAAISTKARTDTYQAVWTRPHTNRILFEAAVSHQPVDYSLLPTDTAVTTLPGVLEATTLTASRNMSPWFSGATQRISPKRTTSVRAAASYVTGSHNLKVGMNTVYLYTLTQNESNNDWINVTTFSGRAFRANFRTPGTATNESRGLGIFAQDQWRIARMTVNAGVRFDHNKEWYPDQILTASTWQPQDFSIAGQTAVIWKDIQPRLGIAVDLFGNGRTALKASVTRAGQRDGANWASALNPGLNNTLQTRAWTDFDNDGFPDGNPLDPAPNGELTSPNTNLAFGKPIVTTFFDEDWRYGWGKRRSNWEFSGSVQHQLGEGVSVDVAYFRREQVNFSEIDNRAVGISDFDTFSLTVPSDPRLGSSSGRVLRFFDLKSTSVRLPDEIRTSSDNFGGESETWRGFDFGINARMRGLMLQGGVSTGRTSIDYCDLQSQLPERISATTATGSVTRAAAAGGGDTVANDFCRRGTNWLTQIKLIGSYMLPYGIQVAGTLQSQPGPERAAIYRFSAADLVAALGRPATLFPGGLSANVIEPGTVYGDRFNQVDLRLTKIIKFASTIQLRAMFDLFNMFNANAVTLEQYAVGPTYLAPQAILPGRLAKFAFQFDF
jgi:hypothetical protein